MKLKEITRKLTIASTLFTAGCDFNHYCEETDSTPIEIENGVQCIREQIFLNFEGYQEQCPLFINREERVLLDPETYCPEGSDGQVIQVEAYEGVDNRKEEIAKIVDYVRCLLEPLGFEVVLNLPESGSYNQINIGGVGTYHLECPELNQVGISDIDEGNTCQGNLIFIPDRMRYRSKKSGEEAKEAEAVTYYRDPYSIARSILHEMGHALGLRHTPESIMQSHSGITQVWHDHPSKVIFHNVASCDLSLSPDDARVLAGNTQNHCFDPNINRVEAWKLNQCQAECQELNQY